MLHSSLLTFSLLASLSAGSTRIDDELIALEVRWTGEVGSAYSRVAGGEGVVVTQGGDGQEDHVIAFEATSGKQLWRYSMGATYLGHDGSADGPLSTPVLGAGHVYAISAQGRLAAIGLKSGEESWSVQLTEELGAQEPEYGYTTTPLLTDGVLIVQVGGSEGRNLCGFDATSGELRWSTGEGHASYQSPVLLELAGRKQVVVLNGGELLGLAPESGEVLWSQRSRPASERDRDASGRPGGIDDGSFYVFDGRLLAVYGIEATGDGFEVELLSTSREFGNTYAHPVFHEGYFYGYRSSFLTCVDAESGKRVWKSRPPGGRGLMLMGNRLVVFGAEGSVVVVRATPEGYLEESRIQALEMSGYSWPSLVEGRVLVRNVERMACLEVKRTMEPETLPAVLARAPSELRSDHALAGFLEELSASTDPESLVADFVDAQDFPIVDGDLVHFVFRGDVQDVGIAGSMTGGSRIDSLERVTGTDFYHRSYPITPGARWEYWFHVDYGNPSVDPLNSRRISGRRGPVSEVRTPEYRSPAHIEEPAAGTARGRIEKLAFESKLLENSRSLQVYLPSTYDADDARRFPVLLVHEGPAWLERGQMANSLDNLIGRSVEPLVVVFIEPLQAWWYEAGGSRTEEYIDMLAAELMPFLEARYRLSSSASDRALSGTKGNGVTSAFAVAKHPKVFGKAGIQSVSLEDVARHGLFAQLERAAPRSASFYVDWNRYESVNRDLDSDLGRDGKRFKAILEASGCRVAGGEALDAHGWASWRARTDAMLEALFPLK